MAVGWERDKKRGIGWYGMRCVDGAGACYSD